MTQSGANRASTVLVGVPGSGKSTVAGLLAAELDSEVSETDEFVEDLLQSSASESFATTQGEAVFREREEEVSLALLGRPGVVVLGSAAVESERVRSALADHEVVWLRTGAAAITRRLVMARLGIEAMVAIRTRLEAMIAERAPYYAAVATQTIDTDRLSAAEVAALIINNLRGRDDLDSD